MGVQSRPLGAGNVLTPEALELYAGQCAIMENGVQLAPYQGVDFSLVSGGTNALVADLTYNQAADVTLVPAARVPSNLRLHLTDVSVNVHGEVGWAGGTYIYLKDTAGATLAYAPLVSLTAFSNLSFPTSGVASFPNVKALATPYYTASTGVLTFAASTFTPTTLAGVPLTVVSGTGKGQTGIIASNTATTITMDQPFAVALDSTSVIGVHYYSATAGASTSVTDGKAAWTSGQFNDQGWYVVMLTGTGAGQVRSITSNSATALTVPTWTTNPQAGDLFVITRTPELMGAICPAAQFDWTVAAGLGAGLKAGIGGTFTGSTSSPIRLRVRGFIGQ